MNESPAAVPERPKPLLSGSLGDRARRQAEIDQWDIEHPSADLTCQDPMSDQHQEGQDKPPLLRRDVDLTSSEQMQLAALRRSLTDATLPALEAALTAAGPRKMRPLAEIVAEAGFVLPPEKVVKVVPVEAPALDAPPASAPPSESQGGEVSPSAPESPSEKAQA